MNNEEVNRKFSVASKWSFLTEVIAKLVPPITNMILARLMTPEAFGMVATVTMIVSFAEIFTDAGFQKFIVQHSFKDQEELDQNTNVAFWTNIVVSLILWTTIFFFRDPLASTVGSPGLGKAIAVAALALPMISFSSIQIARYRRDLDFKTLFFIRVAAALVPLIVTVPLAFILRSYWAMIYGTLAVNSVTILLTTIRSKWKPHFFYNFKQLKEMLSFSMLLLVERLLGWANLNIGIFVVGKFLSDYYLGLYKTSMAYVNQVLGIILTALSPVLLSTLSKLKDDEDAFKKFFYQFERNISIIILPLGIGIFVYRELFTRILLGSQWGEAVGFIGLWALMRALHAVFGLFIIEVFVSKGKPLYSVLEQTLTLIVLLPTILITAKMGYETLYIARSLVLVWSITEELILLKIGAGISAFKIGRNSFPYFVVSLAMGVAGYFMLSFSPSIWIDIASVGVCIVFYFGVLLSIPKTRLEIKDCIVSFKNKKKNPEEGIDQQQTV